MTATTSPPTWVRRVRDAMFGIDSKGTMTWVNPGAELLLGRSAAELVGAPLASVFYEEELATRIFEDLSQSTEEEFACLVDARTVEGDELPLEILFFRNGEGHYDTAVAHHEATEENQTERMAVQALQLSNRLSSVQGQVSELSQELLDKTLQLAEANQKMEAVLGSMGEGLLVVDRDGQVTQINQAACRILDVNDQETLGRSLEDSPIGSKRSSLATLINNSQAGMSAGALGPSRLELHEKVIEMTLAPILEKEGEEESGTVINLRDVTRQAEVDRMKTELISIVSHELRAPLANLTGYVELVLSDPQSTLSEEQSNFLRVAHRNGQKLSRLIDDMLDLSRLESGKIEMNFTDTDLEYLVNFSLLSFRKEAEDRNVVLNKRIDGSVHVQGDVDRLGQVLDNLVSNAIKYSPEGGTVEISAEGKGEEVVLSVSDTGIGISPEDQAR
ncbi:MAG: PAS domain-containing protein, partial [Candidatus Omnitrophica bacterium]|nr:PAS domain-containing protein [Candidatus Omnitrophota bacterium]